MTDRSRWVAQRVQLLVRRYDVLHAPVYDQHYGTLDPVNREFLEAVLGRCPPGARILDAACGTGVYWSDILARGHTVVGVDASSGMLAQARVKFPDVETLRCSLDAMPFGDEFDAAICVDALEMVVPEMWAPSLARLGSAVHAGGPIYLTVERPPQDLDEVHAAGLEAGLPLVDGEYVQGDSYHYYPRRDVVSAQLSSANLGIEMQRTTGTSWHLMVCELR